MPRVIRAPLAELDLDEIWDYIAQDNFTVADRFLDTISERCHMLARHPEMGRLRPELAPDLLSFAVGNHIIFYRPIDDGIEVARVLRGSRDLDSLFE